MDKGKKNQSRNGNRLQEPPAIIKPPKKPNQEFKRHGLLGEGGFGRCYEVEDKEGRLLAVKAVAKSTLRNAKNKDKLLSEIQIHKVMDHPHIVKFYDCCEDASFVYMIMELCENKTLAYMNKKRRRLTEAEVRYFMRQLLDACEYMHRNFVIHRDLKLANLFLSRDMKIKIGDFGLAARLEQEGERKKTICGTPNYIAPEVLFDQLNGHSFEADVWSLGVIMYTLLFGKPPFQTDGEVSQIYKRIKELKYSFPEQITDVSQEAKKLINLMLTLDPDKRPTIQQILDHEFFKLGITPTEIPMSALNIAPSFDQPILMKPRINYSLANRRPLTVIQVGTNFNALTKMSSVTKKSIKSAATTAAITRTNSTTTTKAMTTTNFTATTKAMTTTNFTATTKAMATTNTALTSTVTTTTSVFDATAKITKKSVLISSKAPNTVSPTENPRITNSESPGRPRVGVFESFYSTLVSAFEDTKNGKAISYENHSPTTPRVFISKWMDYSNKYGLGYQLTDGSVGVYYNDKTSTIMSPDGIHFEYIYNSRNSNNSVSPRRYFYKVDEHPKELHKKLHLLKNFRRYMNETIVKNNSYNFVDLERTHNMDFLTKFKRTPHAILFRLSNRLIQVNFFDHEKIVLSDEGRTITYINEAGGINTYTIFEIMGGNHSTIMNRLKYVRDVLKKIVEASHKNIDK